MTPPGGYIQWTPEEDKLLTEAIATCGYTSIPINLAGPTRSDNSCVTGDSGTMISWKSVSKSVPGMFDYRLCFPHIDG